MIAKWWCKKVGHNWAHQDVLEHICTHEWCWRCWETRTVHRFGPWPHTCAEERDKESRV